MKTHNTIYENIEEFESFLVDNSIKDSASILVQVFTSVIEIEVLKKMLSEINSVFKLASVIGSTTDGEILNDSVSTTKTVVSISVFENSTLEVGLEDGYNDSFFCGKNLAKKVVRRDTKALILFSDGLHMNGEFFLDGVESVSYDIPLAGGMAGDGATFTNTYIFVNNTITEKGAVAVSINSQNLHVNTAYSFFWQEIGKPLTVTKVKDNRVYEIEGVRAVDIYAKYLGPKVAELLPATGIEFPLIITRNGVKIARAVLGKENDGSLVFAGNLDVGDKVHFGYGNSNMILNNSVQARDKFKGQPIESIFVYSCMARRRFLKNDITVELTPLSSIAPTSGFFTYGEFYKSRKSELLNQTMTVLALSESSEVSQVDSCSSEVYEISENSATQIALSHLIQVTSQELHDTNNNLEKNVSDKTKELQDKVEELERASKVKSDFLASMSHEIRTPLNAILGFINLLKAEEQDKERIKRFNIVRNSGDTLLTIINDILDFSKIESGKMLLERRKFATKKPFKDIGSLFYEKAKEEGINLKLIFDNDLPRFFVGDTVRIKQVASNFLSNAIKFTPKNGEIIMSTGYDSKKDELIFSVKDTGIGIENKNLKNIFESFTQEDSTTTRRFGGTGLGLTISNALIISMDGRINVESEPENGSTFSFYIPKLEPENNEDAEKEYIEKIDINKKLNAKVLLVEDNKTNQMLMDIVLRDIGIEVDLAENGLEAVEMFKNNKYDTILMDENMPKMSGIEATKIILDIEQKERLEHTPIIALTANALATDRDRFLKAGMDEFVPKPLDHEVFIRTLHSFLL